MTVKEAKTLTSYWIPQTIQQRLDILLMRENLSKVNLLKKLHETTPRDAFEKYRCGYFFDVTERVKGQNLCIAESAHKDMTTRAHGMGLNLSEYVHALILENTQP